MSTPRPLIIAHRGASGYRPEHTRSAYDLAIAMGADAVEPDIVPTKDGVLVLRHENEISGTTDIATRQEFGDRRTTKTIDGKKLTGWFTEDFSWQELAQLRSRERLPKVRPSNATFDGLDGILRLRDLLALLDAAERPVDLVAEIKHASYFESIGLPLDELFAAEARDAGWHNTGRLTIEAFEESVLHKIRDRGVAGDLVYLLEASGSPADLVAGQGKDATSYASQLTDAGLARLAERVDGISVNKHLLLHVDKESNTVGITNIVDRAHAAGLSVFCWTLRAENQFLSRNLRRGDAAGAFGDWLGEFQLLMASGLDGVFADHPDLAVEARARL
ncbi:MAG: glycerophosphodiester phosphodiesterase family protein [Homoserinimonas sp.]